MSPSEIADLEAVCHAKITSLVAGIDRYLFSNVVQDPPKLVCEST